MTAVSVEAATGFINRVRGAVQPGDSPATALRRALGAASVPIGWHEAEVVAEALRHRYDDVHACSQWVPVRVWRDAPLIAHIRRGMRTKLALDVDEAGYAFVDEPVEWMYASPARYENRQLADDERGRQPLTAAQVAALPDDYLVLLKLVGHTQRLAGRA